MHWFSLYSRASIFKPNLKNGPFLLKVVTGFEASLLYSNNLTNKPFGLVLIKLLVTFF